jgi:DNA-binding transcriptional ArsR family regulator
MKKQTRQAVEAVLAVDRLVHEPARLAILTVLASAEWAEFTFLESICGLTRGNLSSHLSKLEAAGLVRIDKRFEAKKPVTRVAATNLGRTALESYRSHLTAVMRGMPKA